MMKTLPLILLAWLVAFGETLPPPNKEYSGVKLLSVQVREINGYKGPTFLLKYSPTEEAKWVRPSDPALNPSFLAFALSAISLGNTLTIVTGDTDTYGFRSISVMQFDDLPQ